MARESLSAELKLEAALGAGVKRTFDFLDKKIGDSLRGLRGFNQNIAGMGKADGVIAGIGRGVGALAKSFRGTNAEIGRTHGALSALRKHKRSFEVLAKDALKAGKSTKHFELKIAGVNIEMEKQERILSKLRIARERHDRGMGRLRGVKQGLAPIARRAGYAAAGAAIGGAYAFSRGFDQFAQFDTVLKTLQAEGVAQRDLPGIREQVLKFAGETRFTALEIGQLLVSMKKDGTEITAELKGFGDLLKFAVAENKDINTAWGVTRTYINATNTPLSEAVTLMEELSQATSLSRLQIEDFGEIAGKALASFTGLRNWGTSGFNAIAGFLADRGTAVETVGITLRQLPLVLSTATQGQLGGEKQDLFDKLGLNITNAKGQLRDIREVLGDFNRVFKGRGFIGEDNNITESGLATLGKLFEIRYANAIGQMVTRHERIAKSMAQIEERGVLDEKFKIQSQTIDHATKIFKSARDALSLGLFDIFNTDDNFIKFFESMTGAVNRFKVFIMANKKPLGEFALFATGALRAIGAFAEGIGKRVFEYFERRGPAIKGFLLNFWGDLKGVWETMRPVVEFVWAGAVKVFDIFGKFAGGNTGLLAWLAAGVIGWKALKLPVMALKGSLDLVLGSIAKVRAAWLGMQGLEVAGAAAAGGLTPLPVGGTGGRGGKVPSAPKSGSGVFTTMPWMTPQKTQQPPPKAVGRFGRVFKTIPGIGLMTGAVTRLSGAVGTLGRAFLGIGRSLGIVKLVTASGAAGLTAFGASVAVFAAGTAVHIKLITGNWEKFTIALNKSWEVVTLVTKGIFVEMKSLAGNIGNMFGQMVTGMDEKLQGWGINVKGILSSISGWWNDTFKKMEVGFDHFLNNWIASAETIIGKLEKYKPAQEMGGAKVALPLSRVHLENMPQAIKDLPLQQLEKYASIRRQISIFDKDDKDFAGRAFKVLEGGGLKTALAGLDTNKAQALTDFLAGVKDLDPKAQGLLDAPLFKKTLDAPELEKLLGLEKMYAGLSSPAIDVITKEIHTPGTFDENVVGLGKAQRNQATAFASNLFALQDRTFKHFTDSVFGSQLKALAELDKPKEPTATGGGVEAVSEGKALDFQSSRAPSVEFVNFKSVDKIATINTAGFNSLVGINDQILVHLQKSLLGEAQGDDDENFEHLFSSAGTPGVKDDDENFEHLFSSAGTPGVKDDDENFEHLFSSAGTPGVKDDDENFEHLFSSAGTPGVKDDESFKRLFADGNPAVGEDDESFDHLFGGDEIDVDKPLPPARQLDVPSITNNQTDMKEGDMIEVTNNYYITQMPEEDVEDLAERIAEIQQRNLRGSYYNS